MKKVGQIAVRAACLLGLSAVVSAGIARAEGTRTPHPVAGNTLKASANQPAKRPRLVVVLVIDQFRYEFLQRFAPYFGDGGFRRLEREGANITEAHYGHLATFTGPGHATIATGSYPNKHGIVANRYFDRTSSKTISSLNDTTVTLVGGPEITPENDTSPRALVGTTVADQLWLTTGSRARIVSVALKDRAAILLAGRKGKAYWFNESTGMLTTSSFYGTSLPAWAVTRNGEKVPQGDFRKTWSLLSPMIDHPFSIDDGPGESGDKGLGLAFPHQLTGGLNVPGPDYYAAWLETPYAVDYLFTTAERAVDAEALGADAVPDLLCIGLSSIDYCGHSFGPDSWEVQELAVHTDRYLANFLTWLTKKFKPGEVSLVFTADHGSGPLPEHMNSLGFPAGRIKKETVKEAMETALDQQFGAGDWVLGQEEPSVYLNRALITERKLDQSAVERVAGEAAMTIPGFAAYFTRTQLMGNGLPPTTLAAQALRSFSPERSGDLFLIPKPFYYWSRYGERTTGATHGSPYEYDTHVPLIFWGAGVRPGPVTRSVDMTDVAPTLAYILGVDAPVGADGKVVSEVVR